MVSSLTTVAALPMPWLGSASRKSRYAVINTMLATPNVSRTWGNDDTAPATVTYSGITASFSCNVHNHATDDDGSQRDRKLATGQWGWGDDTADGR